MSISKFFSKEEEDIKHQIMLDNSAAIHEIKDELKKIQTKLQEQSIHQQKKSDQKLESAIEELKQIQTSHTNQTTEHKKSNQKLASTIELLNRVQFNMQTQSDELKKLETAVTNQTKQQGLLQNLILDLNKNSKCLLASDYARRKLRSLRII